MHPPPAQSYEERFSPELRPGSKPTCIDLHYKVRAVAPALWGLAGSCWAHRGRPTACDVEAGRAHDLLTLSQWCTCIADRQDG